MGKLMSELGRKPLNASIGNALSSSTRIKPDLLSALEGWVLKEEGS